MFPDVARMDAATAAALAQVVPVLMLTLLFEIPVRRRVSTARPRARWLLLGFVLNLAIGATAVVAEFGLLGVVQHNGLPQSAEFVWIASFALFVIVMLRWAATTALAQLVRENGPVLKTGIAAFSSGASAGITSVLANPVQALAEAMTVFIGALGMSFAAAGGIYASAFREIWSVARAPGATVTTVVRDIGQSVVAVLSSATTVPRFFVEAALYLIRRL